MPTLLHLTGGTEHLALEFSTHANSPLLLLAHNSHNSLPAALETLARLRSDGRRAWLVTEENAANLSLFAHVVRIARELRGKKLGLIGDFSPWLVASSPDPSVLRTKLGVDVVPIPLEELRKRIPKRPDVLPEGKGTGVGEEERGMAGRIYAALRRIVAEEKLAAFSLACFALICEGFTACWALARLADEGIPSGCEGDLPGLLALWVSQILTGKPGFLANPVETDQKRERVLLAHCTVPFSLTDDFSLCTHFESGIGLAVAGRVKPGPYTLVRFGGKALEKAFIVEGNVLPEHPGREDLCRTQVWLKMPKGAIRKLLEEPLGNHHVLIPGHHHQILRLFHTVFLSD
ncbi:MAG: hypothetical protein NZ651_04575 [Candidatus Bipolaricaulota bacterium]|nr:hypothetical protein [Candidatus Bipolaricaulota bacterium]MDW8127027.1 hypothetical protein [Candidatus Bipolaricaulota bacterium]